MTVAGQPTVNYTYDANSRLTGISTQNSQLETLNSKLSTILMILMETGQV